MTAATIANTHGLRVTATWMNQDDLFPTYYGLLQKHTVGTGDPTYAGLLTETDYFDASLGRNTYRKLLDNAGGSGLDVTEDLSCDVTGIRIQRGRDSIGEPVRAGTMSMTLADFDGSHDPRNPPAGPSRTGSKIVVEVDPQLKGTWYAIFVGFVEKWTRRVNAGEGTYSEISVDCSDAFSLMARAIGIPSTTGALYVGEKGGPRVTHLLDAASWVAKWGTRSVDTGQVTMNGTLLDNKVLDDIHDVTTSEDGLFWVERDGTINWRDKYWRGNRRLNHAVIDVTGKGVAGTPYEGVPELCPSTYIATDDDLDVVNRAVVWRSVELDPNLGDGSRPKVAKKEKSNLLSISQHGTLAQEYGELPHQSDSVSTTLAQVFVDRLSGEANHVGDFECLLVKHPAEAVTVATFKWGDQLIAWDDTTVTGVAEADLLELVGLDHNITPEHWNATLHVDSWVDQVLTPLGVVAGKPGYFTPVGATPPKDLAALQALGALGQTTAWTKGQFVWLSDGSRAYWTGSAWAKGALSDPTGVTQGKPGAFTPAGSEIPLNFSVLQTLGKLGNDNRWAPATWVDLQDGSKAWWDGNAWRVGVTPNDALAGTPGTYNPAITYADVASLAAVRPVPPIAWLAGQYVPLTGPQAQAHWNGYQWVVGAAPHYGTRISLWDTARWDVDVWTDPPAGPTVIFSDPCDSLAAWTATAFASIVAGGHTGNGLQTTGSANARWQIPVALQSQKISASFWWKTSTLGASGLTVVAWRNYAGPTFHMSVKVSTLGEIYLSSPSGFNSTMSPAGTIAVNTWYFIEVSNVNIADAPNGTATLSVNGTVMSNSTGVDLRVGASVVDEWAICPTTGTQTFDDILLTVPPT